MAAAKQNIFRYLLSYLKQIPVETTSGEYSGSLEVIFFEGRYMLNTTNATYSFEDKYTSYKTALKYIEQEIPGMQSALVLGLGLGSVPYMLQTQFHYKGIVDCVDIDSTIIQLAKKYYPSATLLDKLRIHQADAYTWMQLNEKQFDLIAVDLFIDRFIPQQFHSIPFLENIKRSLSPNGILLFSRLEENGKLEAQLVKNVMQVFPEAIEIVAGGNLILCYRNRNNS